MSCRYRLNVGRIKFKVFGKTSLCKFTQIKHGKIFAAKAIMFLDKKSRYLMAPKNSIQFPHLSEETFISSHLFSDDLATTDLFSAGLLPS